MKVQFVIAYLLFSLRVFSQQIPKDSTAKPVPLVFPMLLEKELLKAGNPLARYLKVIELEKEYRASPFAKVYEELRLNFEEFLGSVDAGKKALTLLQSGSAFAKIKETLPASFQPVPAIEIIKQEAAKTQIVIYGEEHHLPQTRSVYEDMIRELWKVGYRYLAAEAFANAVNDTSRKFVNYDFGFYTQDPVFANAVNVAISLGFKLVDYETYEQGSPDDMNFRDRKQAENIKKKIFDVDPNAKVLVFAGRAHANEIPASDGWAAMGAVLKKITGINPFTMYAPAMTERSSAEEEHAVYRDVTSRHLVKGPTIFREKNKSLYYTSGTWDAYVFFPRVHLINGRPDWLFASAGRKPFDLASLIKKDKRIVLIQAFSENMKASDVPVDQLLISGTENENFLALPKGNYWIRSIDANNQEKILAPLVTIH